MFREQLISESSTASRIQKPDYTPREYLNVWKSSNSRFVWNTGTTLVVDISYFVHMLFTCMSCRPNYVTHVVGQTNREVRNNHTLRGELENLLYKGSYNKQDGYYESEKKIYCSFFCYKILCCARFYLLQAYVCLSEKYRNSLLFSKTMGTLFKSFTRLRR